MILKSACASTEGSDSLPVRAYSTFWDMGKTLIHLQHLQIKAWLCSDGRAAADATCCWDHLLLHVEKAQLSIQLQDWLRSRIRSVCYQWDQMFSSEWRAETIYKANGRIADRCQSEGRPVDLVRAEEWRDLLFTPNQLVRQERLALEESFAARELEIFRMALHVHQIIHPVEISKIPWRMANDSYMQVQRDKSAPWLMAVNYCETSHEKEWHFPIGIHEDHPMTPSTTWWSELYWRWVNAGFPLTECPNEREFNFPTSAIDILNALDGRFRSDSSPSRWAISDPTTQLGCQGHLGLLNPLELDFDSSNKIIRRGENQVGVRRLILRLVEFLAQRTTTLSDFDVLKANWEAFGGYDDPSRGTVDKTLADMKTAMNELNITVLNKPGRGWRLADTSVTSASD